MATAAIAEARSEASRSAARLRADGDTRAADAWRRLAAGDTGDYRAALADAYRRRSLDLAAAIAVLAAAAGDTAAEARALAAAPDIAAAAIASRLA